MDSLQLIKDICKEREVCTGCDFISDVSGRCIFTESPDVWYMDEIYKKLQKHIVNEWLNYFAKDKSYDQITKEAAERM